MSLYSLIADDTAQVKCVSSGRVLKQACLSNQLLPAIADCTHTQFLLCAVASCCRCLAAETLQSLHDDERVHAIQQPQLRTAVHPCQHSMNKAMVMLTLQAYNCNLARRYRRLSSTNMHGSQFHR